MSITNNNDACKEVNDQNIQIFGKYSLGSGNVLPDPDRLFSDLDDPEIIAGYKRSILVDLQKAGIPRNKIKNYKIMDVGTGRQAIAFYSLGAKEVNHYDFSPEFVKQMKLFIESNSLQDKIKTECVDLIKYAPPKNNFDLVFLHGITPCFSNVAVGLTHCLEAVKQGGYISLYFFRSGTFLNFTVYLIRDLIKGIGNHKEYFINSILLYSDNGRANYFVSSIMDHLFAPNSHLYTAKSYFDFVNECGFEVVSSSKLDPFGKDVDHTYAHPSVVLTCKRKYLKDLKQCNTKMLSPEKRVNQLDPNNYSPDDKEILKTINDYSLLKQAINKRKPPRSVIMSIAFLIYSFLNKLDHSLERTPDSQEGDNNHQSLRSILNNARRLIEEEY